MEKETIIFICKASDCEFSLGEKCAFKSVEINGRGKCCQYREGKKKIKTYCD